MTGLSLKVHVREERYTETVGMVRRQLRYVGGELRSVRVLVSPLLRYTEDSDVVFSVIWKVEREDPTTTNRKWRYDTPSGSSGVFPGPLLLRFG